jgi:hypothetical protein
MTNRGEGMSEKTTPAAASPQPLRALELANRVRRARAELKTRIGDGQLSAAQAILTCPPELASMPVGQLLSSQHGWGDVRSRAVLARAAVREDKSIGSLTGGQRRAIASLLTPTISRSSICPVRPERSGQFSAEQRSA